MGLINLKRIRSGGLLLMLITLASATPSVVTHNSVSFAQGRGQLAQASRNYQLGVQAGRQDARRNLSNNYLRHRRQFGARWESDFRQGYEEGYENTFGRGYSNRGYETRPYGYRNDGYYDRGASQPDSYGRGAYGYASAGSMIWRGRVDHYVELRIQGARVQSRERQGAPTVNEGASFTSPLPRADSEVFVRKLEGRGQIGIIQQPSRWNGYTAVIAINDESGGADDYEIEVAWR
jgi:hypothetical protein